MNVKVKIRNFKGIKEFEGDLTNKTLIGMNGEKKSSILSSIMWLLTGYNLDGKYNDVKVQVDGNTENVETFVQVELDDLKLGRSYYESWVKNRETREKEFKGHKSDYFLNDEKCNTQNEFLDVVKRYQIGGLKLEESIFSMMVPKYFATTLDEKKRMDIVFENIMDIEPEQICKAIGMPEMLEYYEGLKDVEKTRKGLVKEANELDKLMDSCETRIDEKKLEEFNIVPKEDLDKQKSDIQKKIDELDIVINNDTSKAKKLELENKKVSRKNKYESEKLAHEKAEKERIDKLEAKDKAGVADLEAKNKKIKDEYTPKKEKYDELLKAYKEILETIAIKKEKIQAKRQEYLEADKLVFDGFNCPVLKKHCDILEKTPEIEELEKKFNLEKSEKLEKIRTEGHVLKDSIEELEKIKAPIEPEKPKLAEVPTLPKHESKPFDQKEPDFSDIEKEIAELKPDDKTKEIAEKAELTKQLEEVIKKYSEHDRKAENEKRIKSIESERTGHKKGYTEKQKKIAFIHKYRIKKAKLLEGDAEKVFGCKVKLFDFQINGTPETCCRFLDEKGVEFGSISNGEGIEFGVRVCTVLQDIYGFDLPILIDDCESLTKEIKTSKTTIKAKVVEGKKLEVV